MAENKVLFNLKNIHYAVLTNGTYSTPVHVPGAVSLSLDAQAELTKFYADGLVYYTSASNNGYEGDLEMARFPDEMLQDIWGFTLTTDKVLVENSTANAASFALLFQIDGDQDGEYYALLNCTATKPGIGGSTSEASKEPSTKSCTITAAPTSAGKVMARTTDQTTNTVKSGWFTATSWG